MSQLTPNTEKTDHSKYTPEYMQALCDKYPELAQKFNEVEAEAQELQKLTEDERQEIVNALQEMDIVETAEPTHTTDQQTALQNTEPQTPHVITEIYGVNISEIQKLKNKLASLTTDITKWQHPELFHSGPLEREAQLQFLQSLEAKLNESLEVNDELIFKTQKIIQDITLAFNTILQTISSIHSDMRDPNEDELKSIQDNIQLVQESTTAVIFAFFNTQLGLESIYNYENSGNLKNLKEELLIIIKKHVTAMQDMEKLRLIILIEKITEIAQMILKQKETLLPLEKNELSDLNQEIEQLFAIAELVSDVVSPKNKPDEQGFAITGDNQTQTNLALQTHLSNKQTGHISFTIDKTPGTDQFVQGIEALLRNAKNQITQYNQILAERFNETVEDQTQLIAATKDIAGEKLMQSEIIETAATFLLMFNVDARGVIENINRGVQSRSIKSPEEALQFMQPVIDITKLQSIHGIVANLHQVEFNESMEKSLKENNITTQINNFQGMFIRWYATGLLLIEYQKSELEKNDHELLLKEIKKLNTELEQKLKDSLKDITKKFSNIYTDEQIKDRAYKKHQEDIRALHEKKEKANFQRRKIIDKKPIQQSSLQKIWQEIQSIFQQIQDNTNPKREESEITREEFLQNVQDADPTHPRTKKRLEEEAAKIAAIITSKPSTPTDQALANSEIITNLNNRVQTLEAELAKMKQKFDAFILATQKKAPEESS